MNAERVENCAAVLRILGWVAYISTGLVLAVALFTDRFRLSFADGASLAFVGVTTGAVLIGAGVTMSLLVDIYGHVKEAREDIFELRRRLVRSK